MNMTAPPQVYRDRRARLAARLERPMAIMAGRARARQYTTNTHPFRAGSSYLYFGGPPVEGACLVVEPGSDGVEGCRLLRPASGFEDAVWVGQIPSDDDLAAAAGVSSVAVGEPEKLSILLDGRDCSFIGVPCPPSMEWAARQMLHPANDDELLAIIDLRLIKDEYELKAMRWAAEVSVQGHLAAIKAAMPGNSEAHVAAALTATVMSHKCGLAFTPTVTIRGEVLHCGGYVNTLRPGDLLVVDAGAEEPGGYAADITRTTPVGGAFTGIQRQLYDTVHKAERAAIGACTPGRRYRDIHDLAGRVVCAGLVEADLLHGDPEELAGRYAHTLFFTHGVGHLLGLDVHDMEDFGDLAGYAQGRSRRPEFGNKFLRLDRDLEPGMVVTIEPGIYLVPALWENDELVGPFEDVVNRPAVDALLKGGFGGIRIEDDVHVRPDEAGGPEVLTGALVVDADEVANMASG